MGACDCESRHVPQREVPQPLLEQAAPEAPEGGRVTIKALYPNWGIRCGNRSRTERPLAERQIIGIAHNSVKKAIRKGLLPRLRTPSGQPPSTIMCVDCRKRLADSYDHRDYSQPLVVEPVCRTCNLRRGPGICSELCQ